MNYSFLPGLNATLNASSAIFLICGYYFIRKGDRKTHPVCMVTAFILSSVFLAGYLAFHFHSGVIHFMGQGWVRPLYFSILSTHTLLAALVPFLAVATLWKAMKAEFKKHKRIARVTLPIWLYVSLTGVVVYWMLYRFYPS